MLADHFPVLNLRLTTPGLLLKLPDEDQLAELADAATSGVHDPATMPFTVPWTASPPRERARSVVVHHWATLGRWTPQSWSVPFAVIRDGQVLGLQTITGRQFTVTRECSSGSWLGQQFHGHGVGTLMRAMIAHFAFEGLGAAAMVSSAYDDNPASLAVSRKVGYRDDGIARHEVQGTLRISRRLRLTRDDWRGNPRPAVTIDGLQECRAMFGLPSAT